MEKHSWPKSIVLHLLPGLLVGLCYFILAPIVKQYGYPTVMALVLSGILVLIPFEMGFLLYLSKKTGKKLIGEVVLYQKRLNIWQHILWVAVIFVLTGLLFKAFDFTSDLFMKFFSRIPSGYMLDMGLTEDYTKTKLIISYALFFLLIVVVLPTVEELYFRGYLLPRMPQNLKAFTGVVHSFLFAIYHVWTPWLIITRTFGVLPLIYIVKWKQNLYLGILAHCLINSIDFIIAVAFIMKM